MVQSKIDNNFGLRRRAAILVAVLVALWTAFCPINIFSATFSTVHTLPDSIPLGAASYDDAPSVVVVDSIDLHDAAMPVWNVDTVAVAPARMFNPDPTRAVWLSALFPGLGQIYNRRFWKLPIVVGAFMGLGYGTSWNNTMLHDYTRAYNDLLDNDPNTKSYMDFFPTTTREDDLDKAWLNSTLRRRKDYFRRNRDLCIICMVGVYLVAMVDAYVDASLAHFDISPDLTMEVAPALFQDRHSSLPSVGVQWAFNF